MDTNILEIKVPTDHQLQWGHDFSAMDTYAKLDDGTDILELQWGHDLSVMDTQIELVRPLFGAVLQWGHDLSVMDTRPQRGSRQHEAAASMGP